jgi:hypothetical protein
MNVLNIIKYFWNKSYLNHREKTRIMDFRSTFFPFGSLLKLIFLNWWQFILAITKNSSEESLFFISNNDTIFFCCYFDIFMIWSLFHIDKSLNSLCTLPSDCWSGACLNGLCQCPSGFVSTGDNNRCSKSI